MDIRTIKADGAERLHLGPYGWAAPCARFSLARKLREWRMTALADDAGLVVSELVSNAVRLGGVFTVTFSVTRDVLLIEVTDTSDDEPVMVTDPLAVLGNDDPDDVGGCGLMLV